MRRLIARYGFAIGLTVTMAAATSAYAASGFGGGGEPDLVGTVVATPAVVQPGAAATLAVVIRNTGTAPAGPFMVQFPGSVGTFIAGSAGTCTFSPTTRSGPARTLCASTGLAAGASSTFAFTITAPGAAGTYGATGTVDSTNAVVESNETNNTATGTYVVPVNGPFDFVPIHTVSGQNPTLPTEQVTFTTKLNNIGIYSGFTTATITETLPIGFTLVSWVGSVTTWDPAVGPVFNAPGSVACTQSGDPSTGVVVRCTGVPNYSGSSTEGGAIVIVGQPAATASLVDYSATDSVTVDSDNAYPESDETNNTATGSIRVSNMLPDLALAIDTPQSNVDAGSIITHNVTISNVGTGNDPLATVRVGSVAGAWIGGGGNGVTCGILFSTRSGSVRGCWAPNLAAGTSLTFPIHLTASGLVGTTTTSLDVYTTGAREVPPNADNYATSSVTVAIGGPTDLSTSLVGQSPVAVGQPANFSLSVFNSGIGLTAATTVELTLPSGFGFVSGGGPSGVCTAVGQLVSCPLDPMGPKASRVFGITATVSATPGTYTVSTNADPANLVAESDETNNSTSVTVVVSGAFADLTSSITGPATVATNAKPTYAFTVTNSGAVQADGVTFTVYSPGFDRVDTLVAPAGFTCTVRRIKNAGNYIDCAGGSLAPGASATAQITVAGSYGPGAWQVSVTADPSNVVQELSETNNRATLTTTVA